MTLTIRMLIFVLRIMKLTTEDEMKMTKETTGRYATGAKASRFAKNLTRTTGYKHTPVKTRYFDMDNYCYIDAWTVVLLTTKSAK